MVATADEAAMLACILANPADDAPRLQFADWLEEHAREMECGRCLPGNGCPLCLQFGHLQQHQTCYSCGRCGGTGLVSNGNADRAEFIRVQCRIAWLEQHNPETIRAGSASFDHDHYEELRAREKETGNRRLEWLVGTPLDMFRELPDGGLEHAYKPEFRRGFVHSITLPAADFIEHAGRLFSAQPITAVVLNGLSPQNYRSMSDRWFGWLCYPNNGIGEIETSEMSHRWIENREIADLIAKQPGALSHGAWVDFTTEAAALAALSASCVTYGRAAARKETSR